MASLLNDFEAMNTAVPQIAAMNEVVELGGINWSLLPETTASLKGKTSVEATRNAIESARSMFNAANVQNFNLVSLTTGNSAPTGRNYIDYEDEEEEVVDIPNPPTVSFEPGDIKVNFKVSARFQADAPRC